MLWYVQGVFMLIRKKSFRNVSPFMFDFWLLTFCFFVCYDFRTQNINSKNEIVLHDKLYCRQCNVGNEQMTFPYQRKTHRTDQNIAVPPDGVHYALVFNIFYGNLTKNRNYGGLSMCILSRKDSHRDERIWWDIEHLLKLTTQENNDVFQFLRFSTNS